MGLWCAGTPQCWHQQERTLLATRKRRGQNVHYSSTAADMFRYILHVPSSDLPGQIRIAPRLRFCLSHVASTTRTLPPNQNTTQYRILYPCLLRHNEYCTQGYTSTAATIPDCLVQYRYCGTLRIEVEYIHRSSRSLFSKLSLSIRYPSS